MIQADYQAKAVITVKNGDGSRTTIRIPDLRIGEMSYDGDHGISELSLTDIREWTAVVTTPKENE